MSEPKAHQVLWFLGTFIVLWGGSLIARGLRTRGPGRSEGVPLVGLGAVAFSVGVATLVAGTRLRFWVYGATASSREWSLAEAAAGGIVAFAATLAAWGWFSDRSRGRSRCPRCWYDMESLGTAGSFTCPECGHDARSPAGLRRTRRRWGLVGVAAGVAVFGLIVPRLMSIERGGVKALLPTTLMVSLLWSLPDPWIDNNSAEDAWTLRARLADGAAWEWQRAWCDGKLQAELERPTSIANLHRAFRAVDLLGHRTDLDPSATRLIFAVRGLASPEPSDRRWAYEMLTRMERAWLHSGSGHWAEAFREARAEVAQRGDVLVPALADENAEIAIAAAEWLAASPAHADAAIDAVLARYDAETRQGVVEWATQVLVQACARRPEVAQAIIAKSRAGDGRAARRLWDGVNREAANAELPPSLLARADEVLRTGEGTAVAGVARFRLAGRHASPEMLAEMLEVAAGKGPRRSIALGALFTGRPTVEPFAGERPVLASALEDEDLSNAMLACRWIGDLAEAGGTGLDRYRSRLDTLAAHADRRVREFAAYALQSMAAADSVRDAQGSTPRP